MSGFWHWLTENFNNRELAGAIWFFAAFIFLFVVSCLKENLRDSSINLIRAVTQRKLLILFGLFAGYVAGLTWLGLYIGLLNSGQTIANVFIWYFIGGLPLFGLVFNYRGESIKGFYRKHTKDVIKFISLVEFISCIKTFNLFIELILILILILISIIFELSKKDPKHLPVNKLANWLLIIIFIIMIAPSVSYVWEESGKVFTTDNFKSFILPPYLTIGSMPFFYILYCYSCFEITLLPINQHGHSEEVKRYAKKRFFWIFFLRPWLLSRAKRKFCMVEPRECIDVDNIIRGVLQYEKEEENPPIVDELSGWSPHDAREFLTDKGLRTGDYHEEHENWWSGLETNFLVENDRINTANYSFSGVPGLVKKITLYGYFVDKSVSDDVLVKFTEIAIVLCERAIGGDVNQISENLINGKYFKVDMGTVTVSFTHERFPSEIGFNLTLEVEKKAAK